MSTKGSDVEPDHPDVNRQPAVPLRDTVAPEPILKIQLPKDPAIANDPPTPQPEDSLSTNSAHSLSLTSPLSTTSLAAEAMQTLRLRKRNTRRESEATMRSKRKALKQRTRARLFHPKEVIGCDRWATWVLGVSALVFLLFTICLCLAFCNSGGQTDQLMAERDTFQTKWKYEQHRADNYRKLLDETFRLIGIRHVHETWPDDATTDQIEQTRKGELWRRLNEKTRPKGQDRSKALKRLPTAEATQVVRKICVDLAKEVSEKEIATYPGHDVRERSHPWIEIPKFSDDDNKHHRQANIYMLQNAVKLVRKYLTTYSERTARVRLGVYDECPEQKTLLGLVQEAIKVPLDSEDYSHLQRVGGNGVSGCASGLLNTLTCGCFGKCTRRSTQCCGKPLDKPAGLGAEFPSKEE